MYFILITVSLTSLLLHPGLGQLPAEVCPAESSGETNPSINFSLLRRYFSWLHIYEAGASMFKPACTIIN